MNHLVIGDIHGCGSELRSLLNVVEAEYHSTATRIILIGDLLTKGPSPEGVVDEINRMRQQGWQIELICGNHEIRLLGAIGRLRGGLELARLDGPAAPIRLQPFSSRDAAPAGFIESMS